MDVTDKLKQILVRIQKERLVADLEQVSGTGSGEMYPFRVAKGYFLLDPQREGLLVTA